MMRVKKRKDNLYMYIYLSAVPGSAADPASWTSDDEMLLDGGGDNLKMRAIRRQFPPKTELAKYAVVFLALTAFALWWTQPETVRTFPKLF